MPRATGKKGSGAARYISRPAVRMGEIEECQRALSQLESETDSTLDQFVSSAENAYSFYSAMEKIESQLVSAERMQNATNDLQLNESVVLAEKLEVELASVEKLASGAAVSETQEDWAERFEDARAALDRMSLQIRKANAGNAGGDAMEARFALITFKRDSAAFRKKLAKLQTFLSSTKNPAHAKVSMARTRLSKLKAGVGETFSRIARSRLKKRIGEAHAEITAFMQKSQAGRIFVDHKHLTLCGGKNSARMPLTEAVGFALSDLAPPLKKSLSRVAKGTVQLVGSFSLEDGGRVLRIGERTVSGDAIIYRERSFRL